MQSKLSENFGKRRRRPYLELFWGLQGGGRNFTGGRGPPASMEPPLAECEAKCCRIKMFPKRGWNFVSLNHFGLSEKMTAVALLQC